MSKQQVRIICAKCGNSPKLGTDDGYELWCEKCRKAIFNIPLLDKIYRRGIEEGKRQKKREIREALDL